MEKLGHLQWLLTSGKKKGGERKRKMRKCEGNGSPLMASYTSEERESELFVWPKMIVVKMWVPKCGPIAQCFKTYRYIYT